MAIRKGVLGLAKTRGHGVSIEPVGKIKPLTSEFVAVTLENLCLRRFFSKDGFRRGLGKREGTLTIGVNGQETSLSWATNDKDELKNKEEKLKDYLVFLGRHNTILDLNLGLIETDKHAVKGLQQAKASMSAVVAFANLVPGVGTIVSAGFSVLGSIVDFIRGQVDDDEELALHGSIGRLGADDGPPELGQGLYKIFRKSDPKSDNDIEIILRVEPFNPLPESEERQAVVMLDSIGLDLPSTMDSGTLMLDLSFGGGDDASKFSFSHRVINGDAAIDRVVGIEDKLLYRGTWNAGIPFSASLAAVMKDDEIKAVEGVIGELGTQAKRFTEKSDVQSRIDNITKAIQSYRALLVEFLPEKISVGNKSGLIADKKTVNPKKFSARHFILLDNLSTTKWTLRRIPLRSESGGSALINLHIKLEETAFQIVTSSLQSATAGKAYSVQFKTNTGDSTKQTWKGSPPCGLSLSKAGKLSGRPTTLGRFKFTIAVADTSALLRRTAKREVTLDICAPQVG